MQPAKRVRQQQLIVAGRQRPRRQRRTRTVFVHRVLDFVPMQSEQRERSPAAARRRLSALERTRCANLAFGSDSPLSLTDWIPFNHAQSLLV